MIKCRNNIKINLPINFGLFTKTSHACSLFFTSNVFIVLRIQKNAYVKLPPKLNELALQSAIFSFCKRRKEERCNK